MTKPVKHPTVTVMGTHRTPISKNARVSFEESARARHSDAIDCTTKMEKRPSSWMKSMVERPAAAIMYEAKSREGGSDATDTTSFE
jgi:hypothetical protein